MPRTHTHAQRKEESFHYTHERDAMVSLASVVTLFNFFWKLVCVLPKLSSSLLCVCAYSSSFQLGEMKNKNCNARYLAQQLCGQMFTPALDVKMASFERFSLTKEKNLANNKRESIHSSPNKKHSLSVARCCVTVQWKETASLYSILCSFDWKRTNWYSLHVFSVSI